MNKIEMIKELREKTGANLLQSRRAVEASDGTIADAVRRLNALLAEDRDRSARACAAGRLFAYVHNGGQIGVLVELRAETDFVTRNEVFEKLGKDICLQAVASEFAFGNNDEMFLSEAFVKDQSQTVKQLINAASAITGERIEVGKICKYMVA